ncbi:outer membrane protein assembly factor BamB family protein [Chitinophaga sp. 22620]|uniref:outer membrane protein assembly factor BamB family protein n=1 Tax=Chitinophaga sp. 22620 TaxID=3453952 RepID=UPI003F86B4AC
MRITLLFVMLFSLIGCYGYLQDGPPYIRYAKGDRWVSNFRNENFPAKTFIDDKLYCSSLEIATDSSNLLYCLDLKTGIVDWTAKVSNWAGSPPIVKDSFIYFSSYVGDIYRFDKNGNKIWEQRAQSAFAGHSLNPLNNNLIVHTVSDGSYELAFSNGEVINHFGKTSLGSSMPVFYNRYMIQAGIKEDTTLVGEGKMVRCIDYLDKQKVWEYEMGENIKSVFENDGKIYFISKGFIMHAIDINTGARIWQSDSLQQGSGYYPSSPKLVFDQGKIVFMNGNLNNLTVLDEATGKLITKGTYHDILKMQLVLPVNHIYKVKADDKSYYTVCVSDSFVAPQRMYSVAIMKTDL